MTESTETASAELCDDPETQETGTALEAAADTPAQPSTIDRLLELAVREQVSVDVLERLEAMHERMMERGARAAFFEALHAFQEECPVVEKSEKANITTKSGSKYGYTYAPLEEITETIRPVLKKHGLSYSWTTEPVEAANRDFLNVVCVLRHIAGHEERSVFPVPTQTKAAMSGAQKQGAALTYGKRQSLTSVLGLTTAEDVDGAGRAQPLDDSHIQAINEKIDEIREVAGGFDYARFLNWLGVEALDDVAVDQFQPAMSALERKLEKAREDAS